MFIPPPLSNMNYTITNGYHFPFLLNPRNQTCEAPPPQVRLPHTRGLPASEQTYPHHVSCVTHNVEPGSPSRGTQTIPT